MMLLNDVRAGIINKKLYLFILILIAFVCCNGAATYFAEYERVLGSSSLPCMGDLLYHLFEGVPARAKGAFVLFRIPIYWYTQHLIIAATIAGYVKSDVVRHGSMKIMYSGSRGRYAVTKILWVLLQVTVCYAVLYGTVLLYSLFRGYRLSLVINRMLWVQEGAGTGSAAAHVIMVAGMPFLVSIVLALLQVLVELLIGVTTGYFFVCVLLAVSAFWQNPFLIGNYSLLCRNRLVSGQSLDTVTGVLFCSVLMAAAVVMLLKYFKNCDILQEQDEM